MKKSQRLLSLLLAAVLLLGLLPASALGANTTPRVHVTVENTTYTEANAASDWIAPAWSGQLLNVWVPLEGTMTMMSCIDWALESAGYPTIGADKGYISEINGVAEKRNGEYSGWMGTLNDWFTNYGFDQYTTADGTLQDGDEIRVMYTSTGMGSDLGGVWGDYDKRLKGLEISEGTLAPAFSPDRHEYTLILPTNKTAVTVTPTAMNKQFQVRTFVGENEYRRSASIPVTPGMDLTVKCGDPTWPTANPNELPGEVYTIHVVAPGTQLDQSSLTVTTRMEEGEKTGEPSLRFVETTGEFLVTLDAYTENTKYNSSGFTAALTVPEGASAVLLNENGEQVGDFANGPVTVENCILAPGAYLYFIQLTSEGTSTLYPLSLSKSRLLIFKSLQFTSVPTSTEQFYGYPEGTIFQLDSKGAWNGKTGTDVLCGNYLVYVSKDTQTIKPNVKFFGVSSVEIYVNGEKKGNTYPTGNMAAMNINKLKLDVSSGEATLRLYTFNRQKTHLNANYTFTFRRFSLSPAELAAQIDALPNAEDASYTETLYDSVCAKEALYNGLSAEEQAQVTNAEKLFRLKERLEELGIPYKAAIQKLVDVVSNYAGKTTADNYRLYLDDVRQAEVLYLGLSDAQRSDFMRSSVAGDFWPAYYTVTLAAIRNGDSLGYPTQYPDDFMLRGSYYNLDLGEEVETGFREIWTNRPKNYYGYVEKGLPFTSPGLLEFEIKDESIFEIRTEQDVYVDKGLGGNGEHENMRYFLVPKKAGTTTFTVKLVDSVGTMYCQTPEIVVHVNSPEETAIGKLNEKLTNFEALENASKYDNWTYDYEKEEGAAFSFHVNGENGKVWVYDYLKYNEDGTPVKTSYPVKGNGDVTVLLKDGYNCIEVNADYEGRNVTQVYALKGKVVRYVVENETRPGMPLRIGDKAGVWIIGKNIAVHKISRIYNNGVGLIRYMTDMPMQGLLVNDRAIALNYPGFTGASEAGCYMRLGVPLTASGTITLRDGYQTYAGYGSGLNSEFTQGNTGGMAASTGMDIGHLGNITLEVADDPSFTLPEGMTTLVSNGGVVRAGESVTVTIPDLPVDLLRSKYDYSADNQLKRASTIFYTTIPGVKRINTKYLSSGADMDDEGAVVSNLEEIRSITFTVPADTPAGTYQIHGGYVDLLITVGFMDSYPKEFLRQIADATITVIPADAAEPDGTNTPVTPSEPASDPFNPNAESGSKAQFDDVTASDWYFEAVRYAVENGLMNGTGDGKFSPKANTTRGMIVTMLARVEGISTSGMPWYGAGQRWAMEHEISDGTNMPGAITREQLAAILYRYAKLKGYDVSKTAEISGYADTAQVSSYAADAMRWAVGSGLLKGSSNRLNPKATATRAETAMILMRFMETFAK